MPCVCTGAVPTLPFVAVVVRVWWCRCVIRSALRCCGWWVCSCLFVVLLPDAVLRYYTFVVVRCVDDGYVRCYAVTRCQSVAVVRSPLPDVLRCRCGTDVQMLFPSIAGECPALFCSRCAGCQLALLAVCCGSLRCLLTLPAVRVRLPLLFRGACVSLPVPAIRSAVTRLTVAIRLCHC